MDNDEKYSLWQFYERSLNRDTAQENAVPQQVSSPVREEVEVPAVKEPAVVATPPPLPVVPAIRGFLFSVSKEAEGEYWPVREGDNSIGSDARQSVCLVEQTVKSAHAVLTIKEGEKGCTFLLGPTDGDCPVTVNGAPADPKGVTCYDRDILTIGQCYELLFVAVDPHRYGLAPKAGFTAEAPVTETIVPPAVPPAIPKVAASPKWDTEDIFHQEDEFPRDEGTVFSNEESGEEDEGTRII